MIKTFGQTQITVNEEGYLQDFSQWTKEKNVWDGIQHNDNCLRKGPKKQTERVANE